ncbi:MAG TPA: hypothetical protein PK957_03045 [Candidatus Dojkabacteria bacterium]|nr:hypothetical protein [Candidatus Dojkabacteria bacterium]
MTLAEMHNEFERKIRNLDLVIDMPTGEISSIFYECLYDLIDKYYAEFEDNEKARKALSLLTVSEVLNVTASTILPNSVQAVLPTDLLYTVLEVANVRVGTTDYKSKVRPISLDSYQSNIRNPFKKPYEYLVWRAEIIDDGGTNRLHVLVHQSGASITSYQVGYIREPNKYTIEDNPTSEIEVPDVFQWEIIDMAVDMFLKSNSILNSNNK